MEIRRITNKNIWKILSKNDNFILKSNKFIEKKMIDNVRYYRLLYLSLSRSVNAGPVAK